MCAIVCDIWGERIERVCRCRERERERSEIWSLIRFHVSLWASILNLFCNCYVDNILLRWSPFC